MAGPWEKYAAAPTEPTEPTAPTAKPWEKYGTPAPAEQSRPNYMQIPGTDPKAPPPPGGYQPTPQPGFLDKAVGLGEAALSVGSSATTGLLGMLNGGASGAIGNVTGGKYGTKGGVERGLAEGMQSATYAPRTEKGKEYLGAFGDFAKDAGLDALPGMASELGVLGNLSKAAKPQIVTGASKAATAVANSPEVYMLGKGAKAVGDAAKNVVPKALKFDPAALELAEKAQQYGINLRPDMLSNNKIIKMMGEALEKVPLSGGKAEARQEAFNKALIKQIGGDAKATRLDPETFAAALDKSGKEIGRIGEQYGVKIDSKVKTALDDFTKDAKSFETKDVKNIVKNYVKEIEEKTQNGTLDGKAFRKLNSKIGRQAATTSNGDLKNALADLQEIMHDALATSIPKDELQAWNTARTQYAKAKTLEPLVAKSAYGDISGPGLLARVTADKAGKSRMAKGAAGEMGDLARIGQMIKEPPSSGTGERNLAYGLLGGGAYANPAAAGGVWGAANLYNRFGEYLIPPPPKKGP